MKRLFDIIVSLTGLIVLLPVFLIIGALIWTKDGQPMFFIQQRVGKNGKLFKLYKFRSMVQNQSSGNDSFHPGNVYRVTGTGKFLRKTKLDELPQLFNVFIGNMSLVGPRPEVEKWVKEYPEKWQKVLSVRPGITDNASILYRDEESILKSSDDPVKTYRETILPRKLELYHQYVNKKSLMSDLQILARTIFHLVKK